MSIRIEDYALIGNTYTAALVGRNGSIDWLCLPRFDAPACFASLVGTPSNGHWLVAPAGQDFTSRRRYRGDTLILETDFETPQGTVTIMDFMPVPEPDEAHVHVLRLVRGCSGTVTMRMSAAFRFDYGRIVPWLYRRDQDWYAVAGPDAVRLRAPVVLCQQDGTITAEFTVAEGETVPLILTWYPSHRQPPAVTDPHALAETTQKWWENWSRHCPFTKCTRGLLMRSLITLKALAYGPTGGIVAAPTTSLPEQIGGVRNWDYRYCWIRDATFTLYSLLMSGFHDEARAWQAWMERTVAGDPADMQIMYGLGGERRLWEFNLDWLGGYEDSRPVRIGNKAHAQFQLDVFGEVMDTLHVARQAGVPSERESWNVQKALVAFVERHWDAPDDGIWEIRGPRRHFTHSKVMAWVAVDRAVKAVEQFGLDGPVGHWRELRARIHQDVLAHGFDTARNTFLQYYGGTSLDASSLMIPMVGFLPATDPRVSGTINAIERELVSDGLVRRYSEMDVDGLPGREGAFLACSFWLADNLAMVGRKEDAEKLFDRLLGLRNDVGLLAEEYDTESRRAVGNFPQAFSHIALINTAHNLLRKTGPALHRCGQTHRPVDYGPI